jgi:hypothetical protein
MLMSEDGAERNKKLTLYESPPRIDECPPLKYKWINLRKIVEKEDV